MELQSTIRKLQSQAHERAKRLWLVDNRSKVLQAKCGDGVEITHTFHYNEGQFQVAEGLKLSKLLFKLRSDANTLLYRKLYESKMARIRVQEYIDRFCWDSIALRKFSSGATNAADALSQDKSELGNIQELFDILFHFERFFTQLQCAEFKLGDNGEDYDYIGNDRRPPASTAAPITILLDDIHGWIIQLFVPYTSCCNLEDRRFLFHHLITCPGIESWGNNLTMHLVTSEQSEQVEIEITAIVEILAIASKLNELPRSSIEQAGKVTLLTEDDFSAILDQLTIPERMNDSVSRTLSTCQASDDTTIGDDILLHPLSLANAYIQSLSKLLLQFAQTKYTVLVKRLAQMICQLSQNVGRLANGHHNIVNMSPKITNQLQDGLDALVRGVFRCYLGLPNIGVQHFLASIPVQFVSVEGLWNIMTDIFGVRPNSNVQYPAKAFYIDHFCKLLLDNADEGIFFLQCLSNISLAIDPHQAVADEQVEYSTAQNVTLAIAYVFFHVAYLNEQLRDMFYKDVRDTYKVMCDRHPLLISSLLAWTVNDFDKIGSIALYLFHSLNLTEWHVRQEDLGALQQLLCSGGLSDLGTNFAKYIIEHINYGYTAEIESVPHSRTKPWEKRNIPYLSYSIHSEVAFMILGIAQRIQPTSDMFEKAAQSTETLTSTIAPYIPTASGVFVSASDTKKRKFMDWCWEIIFRLQLFECPIHTRAIELDEAITSVGIGDHAKLSNDLSASHICLMTYVAFMLSPTSRHFLRFDSNRGWEKIQIMLRGAHSGAVLCMLANVVPGFVYMHGDDFFNHGSTYWLLDQILNAKSDASLVEAGKSYLARTSNEFIDLLKPENGLEVMIGSHAWMAKEVDNAYSLAGGGFSYLDLILHSWIKAICSQQDWMWKANRVSLIDYCAKIAFTNQRYALVRSMMQLEAHRLDEFRLASMSPSTANSGHDGPRNPVRFMKSVLADATYPSLLTGEWSMVSLASASLFKTPNVEQHSHYFAFETLLMETIAETDARRQIATQLLQERSSQRTKDDFDISAVVKQASVNLRKPVDFLAIYRWAQHIMTMPANHNLLPLFLQMFFCLYFGNLTIEDQKSRFFYGHLFFTKKDNLVDALKRRLVQLKDSLEDSKESNKENVTIDQDANSHPVEMKELYHAMWLWIGDARLQKDMGSIEELPKMYHPSRLIRCRSFGGSLSEGSSQDVVDFHDGSVLWLDLVDTAQMSKEFETFQWVSKVFPYQSPASLSRPGSSLAGRSHTPTTTLQSGLSTKLPTFKLRKPATSLSLNEILQLPPQELFGNTVRIFHNQARQFSQLSMDHKSLDSEYLKKLEKLYYNKMATSVIEIPCKRVPEGICRKPAKFHIEQQELKVEENVEKQLSDNRAAVTKLAYDKIDSRICVQSLQALTVMEDITRHYDGPLSDAQTQKANESVYYVFEELRDNASEFPPGKLLSRQMAQMASESFSLCPEQLDPLLKIMGADDRYVNLLYPAFEPLSDPGRFVDVYKDICLSGRYSISSQLKLSTKFDVANWLSTAHGQTKDQRLGWYQTAFKAIKKLGRTSNERPLERSLSYKYSSLAIKLLVGAHEKFSADKEYIQVLLLIIDTYANRPMNTYHLRAYMDFLGVPLDLIRRAITSGQQQHQPLRLKALDDEQLHLLLNTVIGVWKESSTRPLEYIYNSCGSMYDLIFACLSDARIVSKPTTDNTQWRALGLIFDAHRPLMTCTSANRTKEFDQISEGYTMLLNTLIDTHQTNENAARVLEACLEYYCNMLPSIGYDRIKILHNDVLQLPWKRINPTTGIFNLLLQTSKDLLQREESIYLEYLGFISSLLLEWHQHIRSMSETGIVRMYIRLAYIIVQHIEEMKLDTHNTLASLTDTLNLCIPAAKVDVDFINEICLSLRKKWPSPLKSFGSGNETEKNEDNSLIFCLKWLRQMVNVDENHHGTQDLVLVYAAYVTSLIRLNIDTPGTNFTSTALSEAIANTLIVVDHSCDRPRLNSETSDHQPGLRKVLGDMVSLPNACTAASSTSILIWESILGNMQHLDNIAIELFYVGCRLICDVKSMVVLMEACIEQELSTFTGSTSDIWRIIGESLELPHTNTDDFLHQCLEHCCIMTLHAKCVSELLVCDDYASECKIAEELAAFLSITVIPRESARQTTKLLLLLSKFSEIFSRKQEEIELKEFNLLAALVSVHRTLYQWAEGKDSHRIAHSGLLGNLGEKWTGGQTPAISIEWKLYSRLICGYIGKHLAHINITQVGPQSKAMSADTWQEWVAATTHMKDYSKYSKEISESIEFSQQATMSQLDQVVRKIASNLFHQVSGVEL